MMKTEVGGRHGDRAGVALRAALAATALLFAAGTPAGAQGAAIEFGDDSFQAVDRECDDPRFEGAGVYNGTGIPGAEFRDATDCRAAVESGRASLRSGAAQTPAQLAIELRPRAEQGDVAAQMQLGAASYTAQDYAEAARWYRLAAEQRDQQAQTWLGSLYRQGLGVPQDNAEARRWLEAAVAQGRNPFVDRELEALNAAPAIEATLAGIDLGNDSGRWANDGECDDPRFEGVGVSMGRMGLAGSEFMDATDCAAAVRDLYATFRPGAARSRDQLSQPRPEPQEGPTVDDLRFYADQGNEQAQFLLGEAYEYGSGYESVKGDRLGRDYPEALRLYRAAAEGGWAPAQLSLGLIYEDGLAVSFGLPRDRNEAIRWYRAAAAQGNQDARERLEGLGVAP